MQILHHAIELGWHLRLNGECEDVTSIASFPLSTRHLIGATAPHLLGAKHYIQKIRYKHGITAQEAAIIPEVLENATVITFPHMPNRFQFHFRNMLDRRFKLVVKVVPATGQAWLCTFHRSDRATFKSAQKKGIVIKK